MHKSCTTIKDYVFAHNMMAEFFTVSAPGRWMSKMPSAEMIAEDGYTDLEAYKNYMDECSRPTAADEYYYWMEEMERKEREDEKRALAEAKAKYFGRGDEVLTHNPFGQLIFDAFQKQAA